MRSLRHIPSLYIPYNLDRIRYQSVLTALSIFIAFIVLTGCASKPTPKLQLSTQKTVTTETDISTTPSLPAYTVIAIAHMLKGKPYRYGGVTPQGFDCSGLVHYAYLKAGKQIPRTTQEQYRLSQRLSFRQARPGDLLFFSIASRKLSHVGLYAGGRRFIHASTSKKRVAEASLDDPYWQKRLIAVGRIH